MNNKYQKIFLIIIFSFIFILSCSNKNEETDIEIEIVEEQQDPTLRYLTNLAVPTENDLDTYSEINLFLKAKEDFYKHEYKAAFKSLLEVLYYYVPSTYETEALYLIGLTHVVF